MTKIEYLKGLIAREPHPAYIAQLARLEGRISKQTPPVFIYSMDSNGVKHYEQIA